MNKYEKIKPQNKPQAANDSTETFQLRQNNTADPNWENECMAREISNNKTPFHRRSMFRIHRILFRKSITISVFFKKMSRQTFDTLRKLINSFCFLRGNHTATIRKFW